MNIKESNFGRSHKHIRGTHCENLQTLIMKSILQGVSLWYQTLEILRRKVTQDRY